jgi:endonuclease/exonuclease/phosphatase family metal-dependent hydrolase
MMSSAHLLAVSVLVLSIVGCGSATPRAAKAVTSTPVALTTRQPLLASTANQSANRDMKVMTFNLRVATLFDAMNTWGLRRNMVVERIRATDPDILGTQEGLDGQVKFLQSQLPDYSFFGVGRKDGKRGGEMCGVFFKTAKFEKLAGGHFWLSQSPEKSGSKSWGCVFPRMVTWVKLLPKDGGQPFCWFNTHFDAWASRARDESAKLLRGRMNTIAGALPCIVTGDFNAGEGSSPYRMLLGAAGGARLVDAYRSVNHRTLEQGTRHGFDGHKSGARIDWILISPAFQAIAASIDHTRGALGYPSDHFPVTATIRALPSFALPVTAAAE